MKSQDKQRYRELRAAGLRKKTARRLAVVERTGAVSDKQARAIARLAGATTALQREVGNDAVGSRSADDMLAVADIRGVSVR